MRKLLVAALIAFSTFDAGAAFADTSAALLIGSGFNDVYNFGVGARVGVTLPAKAYVGGTFLYHLGTDGVLSTVNRLNVYYFGAEGGYDIGDGPITVRPYVGAGGAVGHMSGPDPSNTLALTIWPGVAGLAAVGPGFVGADLRYLIPVYAHTESAGFDTFALYATAGLKF